VVGLANADTIVLANRLARDSALRASIVAASDSATQKMVVAASDSATQKTPGDFAKVQSARQELLDESEKLNLPLLDRSQGEWEGRPVPV
jgi:hypothetical protein